MSLETLLTLAVAGLILFLALIIRFVVVGTVRLYSYVTGREARLLRRPIAVAVAGPNARERIGNLYGKVGAGLRWVGRGLKWVFDAGVALAAVLAAAIATGTARLVELARPKLSEAQDAGIARMTEQPEESGQPDVVLRLTPVLSENGSSVEEEDMLLV